MLLLCCCCGCCWNALKLANAADGCAWNVCCGCCCDPNRLGLVSGEGARPPNALLVCTLSGDCVLAGLCVFRAFIESAGAEDLPDLLISRLSKSMFKLPAFRLPDHVAPTFVACCVVAGTAEAPFVVVMLLLLLEIEVGCNRLFPLTAAMGGSMLSVIRQRNV